MSENIKTKAKELKALVDKEVNVAQKRVESAKNELNSAKLELSNLEKMRKNLVF